MYDFLLDIQEAAKKEAEKKTEAIRKLLPKLETTADAAAYAGKLLNLKRGDHIRIVNKDDTALWDAWFWHEKSDGHSAYVLVYDPDKQCLYEADVSLTGVVLD